MLEKLQQRLDILNQQSIEATNAITATRSNLERLVGNHNAILGAIEVTNEYIKQIPAQEAPELQKEIVDVVAEPESEFAVMD